MDRKTFSELIGKYDLEDFEGLTVEEIIAILQQEKASKEVAQSLKLRLEEMDPVKLSELEEADLIEDHERLHDYYAEWLRGEHRDEGDWTYSDLLKAHIFVVEELKKRGLSCDYDDELVKKSLYKACKEAIESFVWDWGGEQVRIIIKGGPGSGNIGHAGRAGIHGESDAMSGYGTMLRGGEGWAELSDDKKKEWAAAANGVPDSHMKGLAEVRINDLYLDTEGASGMYLPYGKENNVVVLHSQSSTGTTIGHEMGHHVWHKEVTHLSVMDINRDKGFADNLRHEPSGLQSLRNLGLREYSISSLKEFWADSYAIWGSARQGNKACKGFQENYRGQFPETAKLLDDLFG